MTQDTNALVFDVPFSEAKSTHPPAHIAKLMEETSKKDDLSAEQVQAKLEAAAERKKVASFAGDEDDDDDDDDDNGDGIGARDGEAAKVRTAPPERGRAPRTAEPEAGRMLEEEKRVKLQEHLHKVEDHPNKLQQVSSAIEAQVEAKVEAKLEAAQKRRAEQESSLREKLATQEERAEEVRRRKQQLQQTEEVSA
ncbi:hypothetical protein SYNPS1DRAFT_30048 [Syncephalis pseudoplumigaleata]|uniref:Uncharacterized protein n=1 Tax=Syncephalis pseudoplumigaleata TaxID=1712513 RepID=A0A4P9YVW1_9FUNG|nr:hypothetical protein SYNPS1DRAFT_30048 [Syncephalis pseudoplumigaleata]|eukprot:RKP24186.1 hypothetical protein SYNPS1DRAFT_30048 [Syncephalis pseudoplumigaleata]